MADVPTPLPAQGSTAWYAHYADLDAAARAAQTSADAAATYVASTDIRTIVTLSQTEYDALTPDATTLYVIL